MFVNACLRVDTCKSVSDFSFRLTGRALLAGKFFCSGAPAARRAAKRSPISNLYMGNKRKPMS